MKTLIVDDERLARARLAKLLEAYPDFQVVAEADSVDEAERAIDTHAPALIFLDVAMPGGTGFDLFSRRKVSAHVVFVTAFDEYAARAFDVDALDYLVKPIDATRLAACIARLRARTGAASDRLNLTCNGEIRVVPISNVVMVQAERDYCNILLRDGSTMTQRMPLSRLEARLGRRFVRVHRSTLVSLDDIERFERGTGSNYRLALRDLPDPIVVSRAQASTVKDAIARFATGKPG